MLSIHRHIKLNRAYGRTMPGIIEANGVGKLVYRTLIILSDFSETLPFSSCGSRPVKGTGKRSLDTHNLIGIQILPGIETAEHEHESYYKPKNGPDRPDRVRGNL
jgi:hypothetical protein